jgi:hypothetical protein
MVRRLLALAIFSVSTLFMGWTIHDGQDLRPVAAQPICSVDAGVGPSQAITGCVVIEKFVPGSSETFDFDWDDPSIGGPFDNTLGDGDEIITLLRGGYYFFNEDLPGDWEVDIDCESSGVTFIQNFSADESIGFLEFNVDTVDIQGFPYIYCTFTNTEDETGEEDDPTPTPTRTPTRTPTITPTPTATFAPNLGGAIAPLFERRDRGGPGSDPTPRPTAAAGAQTVRPPSTGDGALR